jgi:pyruvate dehydrogenase (quinone)
VGDGIAGLIEAVRKREGQIKYVGVRHEEAAAFMASGYAKLTGKLGVCVGTTGPGAVHLLNGLYDAALDGAPVVALTGLTFHDLIGTRFIQSLNTPALMQDVALYNVQVTSLGHAFIVGNRACRAALGNRGVAHLAIPKDVQNLRDWDALLDRIENTPRLPLRPQMVIREEIRPAILSAFRSTKPAIIEAIVDPDEQPRKPDEVKV